MICVGWASWPDTDARFVRWADIASRRLETMKRILPIAHAVCVILLAGALGSASAQEPPGPSDLGASIDRVVAPYVTARDFMGVVAVQRDGEAPLVRAYGLASVELGVQHKASDIFMIGSVSKQFTAVAVLLLEQDGALRTSDLVSAYLPDIRYGEMITIEDVLTHTAGVPDIYSLKRFGETAGREGTFEEVVRDLGRMELTHQPGSTYAYSNGGYALLAAIIERVSGQAYGEFLARRLFEPLGMSSTAHDRQSPVVAKRVPGYDPWGRDSLTPAPAVTAAYTTGSGSLWSSATDLLIWTSALHGGRLLSNTSYEKLTRDYGYGYGYGVSVFKRFGRDVIGHDGRVAGYAADVVRYLGDGVTVVVLSNVQSVARDEIRRSVGAAALNQPVTMSDRPLLVDRVTDEPRDVVGVYSFGPSFKVSITVSGGRVLARANEGGYSELVPTADGEWFSRMLYATVRFGRNEAGVVDRLIWGSGERAPVGRRER